MRNTKIICTLGPATDDPEIMHQLIDNGMDVARFNFSHGTHEDQKKRLDLLKEIRAELNRPVAAVMDTKGPEIRLGTFENGKVMLKAGDSFILTTEECIGSSERAHISYNELPNDVKIGDRIMLDDAKIGLRVMRTTTTDIICTVENDGPISDRKGINVPGVRLNMSFISQQDYDDLMFCCKQGYDFVAASFVRSADDVKEIRTLLNWNGGENIKIISKIENIQGVQNIDEILEVSDGIMIARGDLGSELPFEEVPVIQKALIKKVYRQGKPVITATQMLDSMMNCPRPTRAEATDVANAVYDGTSALMLSGETAAGAFPVQSLKTMVRLAERTEQEINYAKRFINSEFCCRDNITHAISHAACTSALDLNAEAVVAFTLSGRTAMEISAFRPGCRVIACTSSESTFRQLSLSWGVTPTVVANEESLDKLFDNGLKTLVNIGLLNVGDTVVLTAGLPIGVSGSTNFIKVMQA